MYHKNPSIHVGKYAFCPMNNMGDVIFRILISKFASVPSQAASVSPKKRPGELGFPKETASVPRDGDRKTQKHLGIFPGENKKETPKGTSSNLATSKNGALNDVNDDLGGRDDT